MRYEFESHVNSLFEFLDSHISLKTAILLNHDICQRPELQSGWYIRCEKCIYSIPLQSRCSSMLIPYVDGRTSSDNPSLIQT